MMMTRLLASLILLLALGADRLRAHSGEIVAQAANDELRLTVMAAPVPLRAGPVEFHTLVQRPDGEAVLDAVVSLELTRDGDTPLAEGDIWQGGSCCPVTADGLATSVLALAERNDGRNRLFYTADLAVPAAGTWHLAIAVTAGEQRLVVTRDLTIAAPLSAAEAYWVWWILPPLGVGVFATHQHLKRRRTGR